MKFRNLLFAVLLAVTTAAVQTSYAASVCIAPRAKETTTTTGPGALTLAGAPTGFQTINTACGTNALAPYFLLDANGTAWEEGIGTSTSSTGFARTTVLKSTNSNSAISLSSGTHTIFINYLGDKNLYWEQNEYQGADIASAATTDIGAATGNYVKVTGTTTITSLGTIQAGARRIVEFGGALTLTHNATSLILPTGANIITVAGDIGTFVSLGSGNWRCVGYLRASGTALQNVVSATSQTASGTSVDFTGIPTGAKRVTLLFSGISTNGTSNLLVRIGSGSMATTGYNAQSWVSSTASVVTDGCYITIGGIGAAWTLSGRMVFERISGNSWVCTGIGDAEHATSAGYQAIGRKTLSGDLDRAQITMANGTDSFDAGTVNILYEF